MDLNRSTIYKAVITNETLSNFQLVNTIESLHEILTDCFKTYDRLPTPLDSKTYIELRHDEATDVMHLVLHLGFKYKSEVLEFKLITANDFMLHVPTYLNHFNVELKRQQQSVTALIQENRINIDRLIKLEEWLMLRR